MNSSNIRTKLITEISLLPEEKLEELYNFIHNFRLGIEASQATIEQTMQFAGCWEDMSDEMFADFNEEVITRRQQAFLGRRSDESSID
jgi:hypothetical protein